MNKHALEIIAYGAAATAALGLDIGVLAALVSWAGWPYLAAATASFIAGGVLLYVLCVTFVFRFRRIRNTSLELLAFITLGLVGLAINNLVMFVAVETAHAQYLVAKCIAAVCTFGANFLLRRNLLFSRLAQPH